MSGLDRPIQTVALLSACQGLPVGDKPNARHPCNASWVPARPIGTLSVFHVPELFREFDRAEIRRPVTRELTFRRSIVLPMSSFSTHSTTTHTTPHHAIIRPTSISHRLFWKYPLFHPVDMPPPTQPRLHLPLEALSAISTGTANRARFFTKTSNLVSHILDQPPTDDAVCKGGGSLPGKAPNVDRGHIEAHDQLWSDYFANPPKYNDLLFRRRF
ncbi:hypothetical protein DFH28DRAFT_1134547 [Melampsora americana]|nr:hypothetical protein DFH28DRAFT_1134547 [Melampsora americana]